MAEFLHCIDEERSRILIVWRLKSCLVQELELKQRSLKCIITPHFMLPLAELFIRTVSRNLEMLILIRVLLDEVNIGTSDMGDRGNIG